MRGWRKRGTALCLVVDRSGSMGGRPLATSALAAAAVAYRAPADYSVLAFGQDVVVAKAQDAPQARRRRWSPTSWRCGASARPTSPARCEVATTQLQRSQAGRRVAVLLSDCRATVPGDVVARGPRAGRAVHRRARRRRGGGEGAGRVRRRPLRHRRRPERDPRRSGRGAGRLTLRRRLRCASAGSYSLRSALRRARSGAPAVQAGRTGRGTVTGRSGRRAGRCRRRCPR